MLINHGFPEAGEYAALRAEASLGPQNPLSAEAAFRHSLFVACARDEQNKLLGTGRVIGDGVYHFQIVDVIVRSDCRDDSVVHELMKELIDYVDRSAVKDASLIVISDLDRMKMYTTHGFELMYPNFYGMSRKL
ncbi:GNAT family N-acetyltransferase [Cohnella cellulosilytica]|uniref:GNAT family N-acetyltransferase n=1 Tax=Cohnella cellulosilytica TaxID=986710 RepID=A0ABW2FE82_9BACL